MSFGRILAQNATTKELRTITAVAQRANDKPAIVVTLDNGFGNGSKTRRYVVSQEDEYLFIDVPNGKVPEAQGTPAAGGTTRTPSVADLRKAREDHVGRFGFGGQWLRSLGKVDECYRSLSTYEIVKVERIDRTKAWGS